jgi:hypothetical protein
MKKLLLITLLLSVTLSFAQQNNENDTNPDNNEPPKVILSVSASPNPFTIRTKIHFDLSEAKLVEFSVKNLLGKTVYFQKMDAKKGLNSLVFDKDDLNKGMYIYSIQIEDQIVSKRLIIR